jgi:hypothetical protein
MKLLRESTPMERVAFGLIVLGSLAPLFPWS